jgi:Rrf2 family protein
MMWEIARLGGENAPVSLAAVSRRGHLSRNSLAPLALALRNRGLLRAVRGKDGGYGLARPSSQITIGEIIEAATGPISIVDCVRNPDSCLRSDACDCRPAYALLNDQIAEVLDRVTLAEMMDSVWVSTVRTNRNALLSSRSTTPASSKTFGPT